MLERKKLKSRNQESQSFLVRYRRTYVLNKVKEGILLRLN